MLGLGEGLGSAGNGSWRPSFRAVLCAGTSRICLLGASLLVRWLQVVPAVGAVVALRYRPGCLSLSLNPDQMSQCAPRFSELSEGPVELEKE